VKKIKSVLILAFISSSLLSQQYTELSSGHPSIQPKPKTIVALEKAIILSNLSSIEVTEVDGEEQKKAANYFFHILQKKFDFKFTPLSSSQLNVSEWKVRFEIVEYEVKFINDQYYSIKTDLNKRETKISAPSQLGLIFGAVTFSEFIQFIDRKVIINFYDVEDWPDFSGREISAVFKYAEIDELMDFALQNKIETLAIASRIYPWYTTDKEFLEILHRIKTWKDRYGAPKIMLMLNIYDRKAIEISNNDDIDSLKKVIGLGLEHGVDKIMILADDTPPFKFGEGYILTSENDKKIFKHMAEAHVYLMNELKKWLKQSSYNPKLYYVPPFYTYEDMNYGDISSYQDTPWKDKAFQPLMRDLNFIGANMPKDVSIIWCGPNVRSRRITANDINDWTRNLSGRVPYLWDNTIYSQHPFTSTPLFTAYNNEFPIDFYKTTGGNGMFVNGNSNSEDTKAAVITTNDYLWDSQNYHPQKSLLQAMERLYGEEETWLLFEFRDVELKLRERIGARKLWFEADTLWTIIRNIRFITEKNPFHYHINYSRLKSLRLQLKNSVAEPEPKEMFVNECSKLEQERNDILNRLKNINNTVYKKVSPIGSPLPNFTKIQ